MLIDSLAPYIVAGGTWQETPGVYLSDTWSPGSLESRKPPELFLKQKTPLAGDVFCETFIGSLYSVVVAFYCDSAM